jgi:flagellar biogenesis protein FliO
MIKKKRITLVVILALVGCIGAVCVSKAHGDAASKVPNTAYWALSDANAPSQTPLSSSTSEALRKLLISIVVLVVIGTAVIYASRKWLPKIRVSGSKHISVLENVQLAPNRAVHLVQVGTQRFLLGSSNESVRMLADVTLALTDLPYDKDETHEKNK